MPEHGFTRLSDGAARDKMDSKQVCQLLVATYYYCRQKYAYVKRKMQKCDTRARLGDRQAEEPFSCLPLVFHGWQASPTAYEQSWGAKKRDSPIQEGLSHKLCALDKRSS
jgi:hypothetical protein